MSTRQSDTYFLYVRHGESEANAAKIVGTPFAKLTENGIAQARKTGEELREEGATYIVCSPFIRAQQTAEIIAGELGIELRHIALMHELHERRMGAAEGQPKVNETEWFYGPTDVEGMEGQQELIDRSHVALAKIKQLSQTGKVIVVGHAVSGFYLIQAAKGVTRPEELEDFHQMPNADYIRVEV
ncbi:MAG: putative phosphatase [Patescibacteria group bacterium]|nr:histidine phosphatase family protein [Candidatus Saccharibacteria bacterium]MDQ5963375.1 putative phosphatase [Patescibacteria group bacterium]